MGTTVAAIAVTKESKHNPFNQSWEFQRAYFDVEEIKFENSHRLREHLFTPKFKANAIDVLNHRHSGGNHFVFFPRLRELLFSGGSKSFKDVNDSSIKFPLTRPPLTAT